MKTSQILLASTLVLAVAAGGYAAFSHAASAFKRAGTPPETPFSKS